MKPDFAEVADTLGIGDPAIVEKDYYLVQLLKLLVTQFKQPYFNLIFAGGTCLSKAYQNTHRMSEDIDIKLSEIDEAMTMPKRRDFSKILCKVINESHIFKITGEPIYKDNHQFMVFEIEYPKNINVHHESTLRPLLLLEMRVCVNYQLNLKHQISSMCADVYKEDPEIREMDCAGLESIISEKLVALLWRTSASVKKIDIKSDDTLIRHAYDIHMVISNDQVKKNKNKIKEISLKVRDADSLKWATKYPEFKKDPNAVLGHGLNELNNAIYHDFYNNYVSDLVYGQPTPAWKDVLNTVKNLFNELFIQP